MICTPPLPQTLQLLDPGLLSGHPELSAIDYEPCIAVLARLDGPSSLAAPGCVRPAGEPIEWIADNHVKGVTAVPGCITVHAGPLTSERLWEQAGAADELLAAARPWVGDSPVLHAQIHRWRYAKPRSVHPERCVALPHPRHGLALPVILAGDAFGGTRVEGAILSGLAAARAVS